MENTIGQKSKGYLTVKNMCIIGMLSALAAVVMLFEIPLWFAPSFYEIDLSEVIVLIGAFTLGPVGGIIIEALKVIINTLFNGTSTGYIGELSNFVIGCTFILPASLIYHSKKTRKTALIGLIVGTITLTIVGSLMNYYVLLPAYSKFYGAPIIAFIEQGAEKNGLIKDLKSFVLLATAPFNLVKGILSSAITFLVYKKISVILHKN
ncbi:MAG TPA: ECF transporter S component [Clostridiales bacterium]|nr:ECF transporter S component [Clostridiales bacterium]